jgi:hypothetical protein
MKHLTLLLALLLPIAALAQGHNADSCISQKLLIDQLDNEMTYAISINISADYVSSKAVLQITKELNGYYATFTEVFNNRFKREATKLLKTKLTDEQVFQFKTFESNLQAGVKSGVTNDGMTIFTISMAGAERKYIDQYYYFKGTEEIKRILKL